MSWFIPVVVAWLVLAAPGCLLLWAARVRIPLPWAWGPAVTVVLVVLGSGVYRLLGISWAPLSASVGLVLVGGVTWGLRWVLTRWTSRGERSPHVADAHQDPDVGTSARGQAGVSVIAAGAGLAAVVAATRWMGGIDSLNGSYDAFFHHSSIAFIRDSGDAFLTTALAPIYGESTFYPTAWSAITALLPFDVVVAANAMMLAMLAALPMSIAAMLLTMAQRAGALLTVAAGIGAISSTIFLSTPAMALVMGLWPFVLGVLCLPPAVASMSRLLGRDQRPISLPEVAFHGMVLVGAVLAHPTNAFSLALWGVVLLLVNGARRLITGTAPARGCAEVTGALLVTGALVVFSARGLAGMNLTSPSDVGLLRQLVAVMADEPRLGFIEISPAPLVLVWVLALLGVIAVIRRLEVIGIAATLGLLLTMLLGVLTEVDHPLAVALVNPWYGARERIAPVMMCFLLLLAAHGVIAVGELVRSRARLTWVLPAVAVLAVVCVVSAVVAPSRWATLGTRSYLGHGMNAPQYVTAEERDFIRRAAQTLPEDAVVIADPRDGGPVFWFEGGVETVFPTLSQPQTRDSQLLGAYLTEHDDRRLVCGAYERVQPTYLYRDSSDYSGRALYPEASDAWRGIHDYPESSLHLVDEQGPYALYEMEAPC